MGKITDWVEKYRDTANLILTSIGVVGALVGIFFLISQTHSLGKQTRLLAEQYEASYRPYLAVEDIVTQEVNNSSISILISVRNYGQTPAIKVDLNNVIIGGADVEYDEKNGIYTFWYESAANSGLVATLNEEAYPPDFIFFPGKEQVIIATVHGPTYEATVSETKVMHIALEYSWGLERYFYLARATLQEGIWTVVENRGN